VGFLVATGGMLKMKFAFIGFGNLGKAFTSALLYTGNVASDDIIVCDISPEALTAAKSENYHTYAITDINQAIIDADIVCITVKGHVFDDLAKTIDKSAFEGKLVISMMA